MQPDEDITLSQLTLDEPPFWSPSPPARRPVRSDSTSPPPIPSSPQTSAHNWATTPELTESDDGSIGHGTEGSLDSNSSDESGEAASKAERTAIFRSLS